MRQRWNLTQQYERNWRTTAQDHWRNERAYASEEQLKRGSKTTKPKSPAGQYEFKNGRKENMKTKQKWNTKKNFSLLYMTGSF